MTDILNKHEIRYLLAEKCNKFIKDELRKIVSLCESQRTIEASNQIFNQTLLKAKEQAFKGINNSMQKPYVIYMVNKYWVL